MTNVQQIEMFEDLIEKVQNVANAIPPANPVPDVTSADDGKVLKATYSGGEGSYDWEDESGGIPDYSQASQGSVLATQYSGDLGWERVENLMPSDKVLPDITGNDNGKVLQAVYDDKSGSYASWVTPSGTSISKVQLAKSDFSYDDKSGVYTMYIESYNIPVNNVINVRSYGVSSFDGSNEYKTISDFNIRVSNGNCYVIFFDSTEYTNLNDYVEIIYFA